MNHSKTIWIREGTQIFFDLNDFNFLGKVNIFLDRNTVFCHEAIKSKILKARYRHLDIAFRNSIFICINSHIFFEETTVQDG